MKNVLYCVLLLAVILILQQIYLAPTESADLRNWKLYTGPREGTEVKLSIEVFQTEINLPRFPGDMIAYSPLKLLKGVNVYVKDGITVSYHSKLKKPLKEDYSLAYCYLLLLENRGVTLPVKSVAQDITYDFSEMTDTLTIDPSDIKYHELADEETELFMKGITGKAQADLEKSVIPAKYSIVEVVSGKRVRYLWIHDVGDDYLYVADPCAPQLKLARIDRKLKVYNVGANTYKVRNYLQKAGTKSAGSGG